MGRIQNVKRNVIYGYISSIATIILGIISRTVFLSVLDIAYLGVNGLFTNILGVLSFAELGIGTAMNYALYKPVAEKNIPMIQSVMKFYKYAYRIIAIVVVALGMMIFPFLSYIVTDPGDIGNINIYYLVFLFNTVTTYFVSYKYALVNAEQKNYMVTNINTIVSIVTTIVNIIVLLLFQNYLFYLLSSSIIGLGQKIFISNYLNKKYPYLKEKEVNNLSKEEIEPIKRNVYALIFHKIGEICVYQTDNIIVSAFINISTVGLLSNYNMIINSVSSFISIIFNSVTASLGNLIITSDKNEQYRIFKTYRFLAFWFYGFSSIAFVILLSPFITLWLGDDMLIDNGVILLIVINYYMVGHRIVINNMKCAAGIFQQDKFIAIIQAIVNLTVSIIGVKLIGLPGVFVGTIVQGMVSTIFKPIMVYKCLFEVSFTYYFIDAIKYAVVVCVSGGICSEIHKIFLNSGTLLDFIGLMFIVTCIPNVIFLIVFGKSDQFQHAFEIVRKK